MTDIFDAKEFLKNLTTYPGVYQMFDIQGGLLYVGKAKSLKKRVTSYFRPQAPHSKTYALVSQISRIDVIVTRTENEALLLENNLIKKYKPRFNILLRDDKSYPYLFLSDHKEYPRMDFHRGPKREKGHYFGPYLSAGSVRETLNLLQKLFKIRQCDDVFFRNRTRPCLQYQIQRCTAPCVGYIDPVTYRNDVQHAVWFLQGKNQAIIDDLIVKMETASTQFSYEVAAQYRDQIAMLRRMQEKQYVMSEKGDIDLAIVVSKHGVSCVHLTQIRNGMMLGNKTYFPQVPDKSSDEEVLSAFISQHYFINTLENDIPNLILTNYSLPDAEWLAQALSEFAQHKVAISKPQRGDRVTWLNMALNNATRVLINHLASQSNIYRRFEALQQALKLENVPARIECFDISHTMGEATVASCVVFNVKGPTKNDYRRFNITDITPGDDYAAMKQALYRRYKRLKENEGKLPDIILIDGGRGQLHQAEVVLRELQVSGVMLIGVAKGEGRKPGLETLWIAGKTEPLNLASDSEALHLIQQIRDEAHRFAITGHRKRRGKVGLQSILEQIPGIGAKRRQELLRQLGGLQEISRASVEDLANIPGISLALAQRIYDKLHS